MNKSPKSERTLAIIDRILTGSLYKDIAAEFDVGVTVVSNIAARNNLPRRDGKPRSLWWGHKPKELEPYRTTLGNNLCRKLGISVRG